MTWTTIRGTSPQWVHIPIDVLFDEDKLVVSNAKKQHGLYLVIKLGLGGVHCKSFIIGPSTSRYNRDAALNRDVSVVFLSKNHRCFHSGTLLGIPATSTLLGLGIT